jgi:hypothetical protein
MSLRSEVCVPCILYWEGANVSLGQTREFSEREYFLKDRAVEMRTLCRFHDTCREWK